jgi:hypothetical protein
MSCRARRRGSSAVASAAHIDLNALRIFSSSQTDLAPKAVSSKRDATEKNEQQPYFTNEIIQYFIDGLARSGGRSRKALCHLGMVCHKSTESCR